VQHARQLHVIDKAPAPGKQCRIFKPLDARAKKFRAHCSTPQTSLLSLNAAAAKHNPVERQDPSVACKGGAVAKPADGCGRAPRLTTAFRPMLLDFLGSTKPTGHLVMFTP
jgi:hypothetical protein